MWLRPSHCFVQHTSVGRLPTGPCELIARTKYVPTMVSAFVEVALTKISTNTIKFKFQYFFLSAESKL